MVAKIIDAPNLASLLEKIKSIKTEANKTF